MADEQMLVNLIFFKEFALLPKREWANPHFMRLFRYLYKTETWTQQGIPRFVIKIKHVIIIISPRQALGLGR